MPRYRSELPQRSGRLFVTDGGLETTLVFHDGIDLPEFAAFVLLASAEGRERLRGYYRRYLAIARASGAGFVLESPTWRASRDWGAKLGYSPAEVMDFNRSSIELLAEIRAESEAAVPQLVVSGCIGPRGLGYTADDRLSAAEAEAYHREQIATFRDTEADLVTSFTIPTAAEAIGIARAAAAERMPCVVGLTVETDGRLPSGEALRDAVERTDDATGGAPAYYMVNCAHPSHFEEVLDGGGWVGRIGAIRANASMRSHAELDAATELDDGDPSALGLDYVRLLARLPGLTVVGGCCGTDDRHVSAMCRAILAVRGGAEDIFQLTPA